MTEICKCIKVLPIMNEMFSWEVSHIILEMRGNQSPLLKTRGYNLQGTQLIRSQYTLSVPPENNSFAPNAPFLYPLKTTHSLPMYLFCTPWKHQKTVR